MATRRMTRSVVEDGRTIVYRLDRKEVKNLNLRVRRDGSVSVSAGRGIPCEEIDRFVQRKARFVLSALDRFAGMAAGRPQAKKYVSGESFFIQGHGLRLKVSWAEKASIVSDGTFIRLAVKNPADAAKKKRMVQAFLNRQCQAVFGEILHELHPLVEKYGVEEPVLRIRDMETRWGTCQARKGVITLSRRLLEAPRHCIEYVVLHELCHFIHPNHSKRFYERLAAWMPDWKVRKRLLDGTPQGCPGPNGSGPGNGNPSSRSMGGRNQEAGR
ncbi:MAG: M48 family metallopeptidase [Kiritimatiellae bacterium]|nr:M48 family metallopeptidase [Kiritimatiellia bacterium]